MGIERKWAGRTGGGKKMGLASASRTANTIRVKRLDIDFTEIMAKTINNCQMSLICEKIEQAFWIRLNRPLKRNAIDQATYTELKFALLKADQDPDIIYTVFTGEGNFFTSGNDFKERFFLHEQRSANFNEVLTASIDNTIGFIDMLIAHRKILIALVNGPAIGIGCTMLALFDYVIASSKAYFACPFTELGMVSECTSSINFPAIMGYNAAARILLFGEQISANEAQQFGLVSKIVVANTPEEFARHATATLRGWQQQLAPSALLESKTLMRNAGGRQALHDANHREAVVIKKFWRDGSTLRRIANRFAKKRQLPSKI